MRNARVSPYCSIKHHPKWQGFARYSPIASKDQWQVFFNNRRWNINENTRYLIHCHWPGRNYFRNFTIWICLWSGWESEVVTLKEPSFVQITFAQYPSCWPQLFACSILARAPSKCALPSEKAPRRILLLFDIPRTSWANRPVLSFYVGKKKWRKELYSVCKIYLKLSCISLMEVSISSKNLWELTSRLQHPLATSSCRTSLQIKRISSIQTK